MTDPLSTKSEHPGNQPHPVAENLIANFGFNLAQIAELEMICEIANTATRDTEGSPWPERAKHYRELFGKRRRELAAQLQPKEPA